MTARDVTTAGIHPYHGSMSSHTPRSNPRFRSARRWGGSICLAFGLAFANLGATLPQDEEPEAEFVRCTKCKNLGARPCSEHKASDCELEDNVLFCSRMGGCEPCGGTGWVDCPHCENETTEKRLATKRDGVPGLLAAAAKIDEAMTKPVHQVETEHFVIVCELAPQKVGRKRVGEHGMIHLYADRLEQLFTDYTSILGASEREFRKKCLVMIWAQATDHKRAASYFCSGSGGSGVKLLGLTPTYSVPGLKSLFKDDETLHRNVVHNTVHLLMSHQEPILWIGNLKGGWADAGLAHWFEFLYWEKCDNYCYEEVDTSRGFKGGKWKPTIRKMVAAGKESSLGELLQQNTTTLDRAEHGVAFSLVDYLMSIDPARLNAVPKRLRTKVAARDALKQEFGLSILQLEEKWRAWVLQTYPSR